MSIYKKSCRVTVMLIALTLMASPASAMILDSTGVSGPTEATFVYDFSSSFPTEPYDGWGVKLEYINLSSAGELSVYDVFNLIFSSGVVTATLWGGVPSGPIPIGQTLTSGNGYLGATGSGAYTDGPYTLRIAVTSGSIDLLTLAMEMRNTVDLNPDPPVYTGTGWIRYPAAPVPEPTTMLLLGLGLFGLAGVRRFNK